MQKGDEKMKSIWSNLRPDFPQFSSLDGDLKTDVLVIGGGIAGILCAYQLTKAGVDCVLVEGKQLCSGVTQNTTAKITAQHGLMYDKTLKRFGNEQAKLYYEANTKAIDQFRSLSQEYPCDFEEKTAYLYSRDNLKKLEEEIRAYDTLGIPHVFETKTHLPFETVGAVGMTGQAQFHPLKLIKGLLQEIKCYENTFVTEIQEKTAITSHGNITAKNIILATHFPLVNIPGLYFLKLKQHRSYVVALKGAPDVGGMYIDENQKGYSFRNYKDMLLLGGGGHPTGKKGGGLLAVRNLAQESYPRSEEVYNWAAQDCMTLDHLPYIGIHRRSTMNLFVATGFNKWGMTGSMMAASVLTDLITIGHSPYEAVLSPQRSILRPKLFANIGSAAFNLLRIGKRCPHMGCALKWNAVEKSWDCPCHGSRFDEHGHVINNPAKRSKN